jgi:hypothetical protein
MTDDSDCEENLYNKHVEILGAKCAPARTKKQKSPKPTEIMKALPRKKGFEVEYEPLADDLDLYSEEDELPPRR